MSGLESPLSLGIAFTAGILSFLSPCVLPLVPSYVTFITGMSLEDLRHTRREALVHAVLFVIGFSMIFLALGAGATAFGQLMIRNRDLISRIGGVMIIVFGLSLLGVLNLGILARDTQLHLANKPLRYFGTVLVGIAFGAGWSPCIGPILGAILTMAANEGTSVAACNSWAPIPRGSRCRSCSRRSRWTGSSTSSRGCATGWSG